MIFKPKDVTSEPVVEMSYWSIRSAIDGVDGETKHLVGCVDGFGRVSSPITEISDNHVYTSSGRIYKLIGNSGNHPNAVYVWMMWLEANSCWEKEELEDLQ